MNPVTLRPGIGDNRPSATLYYGQDVRETLRTLPEASVHTVCTSPPYFGLRDYGHPGQIGLEPTPEGYVAELVGVFREVRRVLRPDGTLWVNLGDSYTSGGRATRAPDAKYSGAREMTTRAMTPDGLKGKDLIGIPWRVAFALQADGWYLRQDIIWHKPNPMPESVKDRCTKAHEYLFLLAKSERYFFDSEAMKEPAVCDRMRGPANHRDTVSTNGNGGLSRRKPQETRNRRSVWSILTQPYMGSHCAVWPPDLVRPMILAGTSAHGVCSACGSPCTRTINREWCKSTSKNYKRAGVSDAHWNNLQPTGRISGFVGGRVDTVGGEHTCDCTDAHIVPATVLDPFSGSATTGMVALQEGRNYIGIDLNPDYLPMAEARVREERPPDNTTTDADVDMVLDLFGGAE